MIKVFLPGHANTWKSYTSWMKDVEIVDNIKDATIVLFCGGTDVGSRFYGESPNRRNDNPDVRRDTLEKETFKEAQRLKIPCVGVCRGSQLLCALSGGKLVQHQDNPGNHMMLTYDNKNLRVTSSHHQAQYPFNMVEGVDYKILGWTENMLVQHLDGDDKELSPEKECEIVFYPKTNSLSIQHHPEWMDFNCDTNIYCRNLLDKFLNKEL